MSLTRGTHRGPYENLAAIGQGGMGHVYRARDTRLGRTVAIKASADGSLRSAAFGSNMRPWPRSDPMPK